MDVLDEELIKFWKSLNEWNVPVPFLHINQLIQNKKAINRPKDMIDVIELEKIIKFHQQQEK